ncbi:hypothetical protein FACS1894162_8130 [Bacteroidia bacterium]|nr:hypothetical protein FACS1894162_8130 [Bacteroidia bacterium]
MLKAPLYLRSIYLIHKEIRDLKADVVVNFYEMMTGLTYALYPPKVPYVSVAHQYSFLHPEYSFPNESKIELFLLKFFTYITCLRSKKLFALSMTEKKNIAGSRVVVVPPLLREEILQKTPTAGNYLHGYLLNATYADEIIEYQKQHPEVYMYFFWDKKDAPDQTVINDHLTFHKLDDKLFIDYMVGCKGYATTAGFESVCEAMYLGKPVLMVPTHIEQCCNAHEAVLAGAGIADDRFNIDKLVNYLPDHHGNTDFHRWAQQSEQRWREAFREFLTPN